MKFAPVCFAIFLALGCATAASAAPAAPAIAAGGAHAPTADDLDAYFDGFLPLAIGRGDIAGAEVLVVKDGKILFEKGYGVADVKTRRPVDPATTLFRPGSISKLFTWTSVMQLVEQHKLDLDRDVNDYLDFKIPQTWSKPITLRDIMTHTPGFEETIKGLLAEDPKKLQSLGAGLKSWVPERMFPPGETPAYSNYGAALAGYIVQRVSGEPFEQYVAHHIFQPLGMTHSTFVQPLPAAMAKDMSQGYDTASEAPKPFELIWMSPAGALSTTAEDISKFMIAQLNDGAYGNARILLPQTARLMHSEIYQRNPPLPGIGLGFYHEDTNGHVIIGHGGDTIVFHSDLHLILDEGVGFYYSQNSAGKENSGVRGPLFRGFMDRYFPAPAMAKEPTLKSAKADGALAAGIYALSRRPDSNFMKITASESKVSVNDDGTLSVDDLHGLNGNPLKWREVRPFAWREVNGGHLLVARRVNGEVREIATDDYPQIVTLTRSPLWQSSVLNVPLLIGTLAMLVLTVVFWPVKAVLRWRYDRPFTLSGRAAAIYRLTRIVMLLDLVFLGGFLGVLTYGAAHLTIFNAPLDWLFLLIEAIGLIGVVGTAIPLYEVWIGFRDRARPWWTKGSDVLNALACLAVVWFAVSLNLLTFNISY